MREGGGISERGREGRVERVSGKEGREGGKHFVCCNVAVVVIIWVG